MSSNTAMNDGLTATGEDWNDLILKVGAEQDKAAFAKLFDHFSPPLKGFLLKSEGVGPEQAEELVQETMLKLWRKAPTYSPSQAAASTWIYTIARNTRIDWIRKHYRENTTELTAEDIYPDSEDPSPHSSLLKLRDTRNIQEQLAISSPNDIDDVVSLSNIAPVIARACTRIVLGMRW